MQTRGFNAFSYADTAAELGVTKPTPHCHFRSKKALGDALIARYSERFFRELDAIGMTTEGHPPQTLPVSMRTAVRGFFERNEMWLANVLRRGVERGEVAAVEPLEDAARLVIDTLEGAMMIARAHDGPERFDSASSRMIAGLLS